MINRLLQIGEQQPQQQWIERLWKLRLRQRFGLRIWAITFTQREYNSCNQHDQSTPSDRKTAAAAAVDRAALETPPSAALRAPHLGDNFYSEGIQLLQQT